MHHQLEELHQDHLNLAKVLRLLERQLADVRAGEHTDLTVLSGIVDYVELYPDQFHHPSENAIFSAYLDRYGDRHNLFDQLSTYP